MLVQTRAIHFSADQKLVFLIQKKLQKLEQFFDRILGAEVVLKLENSGRIKDKILEVRVKVPGNTLITKATHKTFEAAIDNVVSAMKKQLIKHKERIRRK
ncbi:MAG: ribosome-associated translation inhibitor RaiA [Bacteroidota bacterium]